MSTKEHPTIPPKGTMRISLDGLRHNATRDFNKLSEFLHELISVVEQRGFCHLVDEDELVKLTDKVGQNIGVLNCTSTDKLPDFNDLSEKLTIDFLSDKLDK
jgi:hypothetical protein